MFAYCNNNPINYADPNGDILETVFDVVSLGFSIFEVATNPYDFTAWLGLAGDIVDVVPFVTGFGEVIRGVRLVDKKTKNVIEIAEALDFTDDAIDTIKTLDKTGGFTKSTADAGKRIHKGYKYGSEFDFAYKEYSEIPGIRPDYYDLDNKVIYELKPFNPYAAQAGIDQLRKYNIALGGNNVMRLEMY